MQYDLHSRLWPSTDSSRYFSQLQLSHRQQIGGTCVSTALSLLTHDERVCRILCNRDFGYCRGSLSA